MSRDSGGHRRGRHGTGSRDPRDSRDSDYDYQSGADGYQERHPDGGRYWQQDGYDESTERRARDGYDSQDQYPYASDYGSSGGHDDRADGSYRDESSYNRDSYRSYDEHPY